MAVNSSAVVHPTFQQAMRIISAITRSDPAVVTTTFAHNYITGSIVRLYIPLGFGMPQANQLTGSIAVLSDTTFSINIDTTSFEPFVVPGSPSYLINSVPHVVPVGEVNSILGAATQNVLPYGAN